MKDIINFNEEEIQQIKQRSFLELDEIKKLKELDSFKKKYLSEKNSLIPLIIIWISNLEKRDDKIKFGKIINEWRKNLFDSTKSFKIKFEDNNKSSSDCVNLNLLGKKLNISYPHPVRKIINEIYDFFVSKGYQIYEGPEIDSELYNFDKLNMPKNHPARSFQDTFYLKNTPSFLLRTHSSNCQARVMEENKNHEIKVVSAGKTYRRDDDDATHSHQYTNLEVIAIGKNINQIWAIIMEWFVRLSSEFIKTESS